MKEISAFEFGLSLNPIGLLADLDKIRKIVQEKLFGAPGNSKSIFPDLSELIAGSGVANVPDIQANPFRQQIAKLLDRIGRITIVANAVNFLSKAFEEKRTDLERINRLIADVKVADFDVNGRIVQIDRNLKANPNAFNKDELLAEQKILEERALALFDFLNQLEIIRDNLQKGAIAGVGIGPERIATDTPFLGFPGSSIPITLPKFDFIREFEEEFQKIEEELQKILGDGNVTLEERAQILNVLEGATAMFNGTMSDTVNPLQAHKDALEASNNVSADLKDNTEELAVKVDDSKEKFEQAKTTVDNMTPSVQNLATANQNVAQSQDQVTDSVDGVVDAYDNGAEGAMQFAEETENASQTLDALGVFAADIAANINDTFADLISNGLQGNFDNLGDLWDATLDSMLDSISQLAATILSNPIRVFLEGALRGSSTSTSTPLPGTNSLLGLREGEQPQANNQPSEGLSTQSKIGAGLILGGAAISAIGGAIENNIASSIVGGIGQTVSFAGAGFAAFGAIGAVIGAIIGLVTSLVSVIS